MFLYVQVAAPGEGPVEAAAGPRWRPVGQQQSVWAGQDSGRDLSHLGETGRATMQMYIDIVGSVTDLYLFMMERL